MAVTEDVEVGKAEKSAVEVEVGAVKPAAEKTIPRQLCFWASNVLGLLCGLLFGAAGFGKVTGGMDEMIEQVLAPFYGVPPVLFKLLAFCGHFTGGICMIGGIIAKIAANFLQKKADLLETLILMDGIGLTTIAIGAVFQHVMTNQSPGTPLLLVLPFLPLRFAYDGWAVPDGNVFSTGLSNKKLLLSFLGVNVVGFLISLVMHVTIGTVGILHE